MSRPKKPKLCQFCQSYHPHTMEGCPRVAALEYHPDGNLKRVELVSLIEMYEKTPYGFFDQPNAFTPKVPTCDGKELSAILDGKSRLNGHGAAQ